MFGNYNTHSVSVLETLHKKKNHRLLALTNWSAETFYPAKDAYPFLNYFEGIVVLDEAYYDFSGQTFIDQMSDHNNLVILRSLSKIGLAGLRVGYGIFPRVLVDEINKIRLPYNSNSVTQLAATELLNNFSLVQKQIDSIKKERI